LDAANLAGIEISGTFGTSAFRLEGGNNPANTGQSILEGKVKNTETGNQDGLFIRTAGAEAEIERNQSLF
jgi:hypothetical protein